MIGAGLLASCASDPRRGYAFTTDAAPAGVRTVCVPVFANTTMEPGVEARLTEAVIKQVQATTSMRVVQRADRADSTLAGAVTDVQMRRLSLASGTGLVQEVAVTLTVDFEWRDNRTGEVLAARRRLVSSDSFVPARPTGERMELGQTAAAERVAQTIVGMMQSSW
jgi:hypothetical protein